MRPARVAAAGLALALVPACTFGVRRAAPTPSPTVAPTTARPTPSGSASPASCPAEYAAPLPSRPHVTLTFDLGEDGRTVRGTERVAFTPDRQITELVFRAWANAPGTAENGGRLEVTRASLPMTVERAGGHRKAPGTLIRLALPRPSPAGRGVVADLAFTLTLPESDVDRYGYDATTAWWGSGHPMLAWQNGRGWATEPAVGILGETATSEAADFDVTVTAPARYTVVASGLTGAPSEADGGRKAWHFENAVARDVAVVAGQFEVETFSAQGTPVLVAMDASLETRLTAGPIRANVLAAFRDFTRRFGRFPYESLTVVALPAVGGAGIEYPGLIFVGDRRYELVVTHEVAHEWFYGLVGNNQAVDPWLDEAFATYAETLVNDTAENHLGAYELRQDVGLPMTYWHEHPDDYGDIVYSKGAAALLLARRESPELFDDAIRCYVNARAYRIATVADLAAALAGIPRAVEILREAGAL
ncbi:MAG TPA: M1 family aminopeptidase [Frankiaceae bacterium]|nr:M1 family aminopeptidase [Frankiaceae bacterium]